MNSFAGRLCPLSSCSSPRAGCRPGTLTHDLVAGEAPGWTARTQERCSAQVSYPVLPLPRPSGCSRGRQRHMKDEKAQQVDEQTGGVRPASSGLRSAGDKGGFVCASSAEDTLAQTGVTDVRDVAPWGHDAPTRCPMPPPLLHTHAFRATDRDLPTSLIRCFLSHVDVHGALLRGPRGPLTLTSRFRCSLRRGRTLTTDAAKVTAGRPGLGQRHTGVRLLGPTCP